MSVPQVHPWALVIQKKKLRVGTYMEKVDVFRIPT